MEVSNATLTAYIDTFNNHKLDPKELLSGTSLSLEYISNPKGKITWTDFETITNNTFNTVGEENTLVSLRTSGVDNTNLSIFKKICAATVKTESVYWFFCAFVGKLFYKNLTFEYKKIAKGHIQIKIVMNDGHKCFPNFLKAYSSAFECFPSVLGLNPAKSTIDQTQEHPIINLYFNNSIKSFNPIKFISRYMLGRTNTTQLINDLEQSRHEQQLLNVSLEKLNKKLGRSNRLNESLIRTIMHDLNNPLAIIRLKNEKLLNENLEFNKKDKEIMNRASENMYNVIQDLRNFHLAKQVLQEDTFSVLECIEEARKHFQEKLEEKNLDLIITSTLDSTLLLKGNRVTFINSILANLISNAIKFSFESGTIKINIKEHENKIIISIKDEGTGMKSSALESFSNNDLCDSEQGTLGEMGLGIGLTQVTYFVKEMGGSIQVETRPYSKYPKSHGTEIHIIFDTRKHLVTVQ